MKINCKTTLLAVVGLLLVSAGCRDSLTTGTAARGKKTTISAHSVVTFYLGEAADYFSEQKQILRPASGDISITAREPEGTFRWQLAGGSYKSSGLATATVDQSPVSVIDRDIVMAIITAFTASAGYYTPESGEKLDQIRMDGKWYLPIQLPGTAAKGAGITLLQSDDGAINSVQVHTAANDALTTARAYNIRWLSDAEAFVPTKIDIFRRTASEVEDTKILQIHYDGFSVP